MDFETMDWEAEVRRVKAAFGLEVEYQFVGDNPPFKEVTPDHFVPKNMLLQQKGNSDIELLAHRGKVFKCGYYESLDRTDLGHNNLDRGYIVETSPNLDNHTMVAINGLGEVLCVNIADPVEANFLAKGLFNLGSLTPAVESALRVSITAHQKMEWVLEYEARYGF